MMLNAEYSVEDSNAPNVNELIKDVVERLGGRIDEEGLQRRGRTTRRQYVYSFDISLPASAANTALTRLVSLPVPWISLKFYP